MSVQRRQSITGHAWVVALTVLIMPSSSVRAAEPEQLKAEAVTLDELLAEAMRKSPGLQAKRHAYEAARARIFAAWLPGDPEIGADVEGQSHLFRFDRTDNEYLVQQKIPFPTTLWLRGRAAMQDARIASQRYKEAERDIAWHIEQPYYELFLAKRTLGALEQTRGLADRLSKAVQARYESNQAPQQDLLKARIETSKLGIETFEWQQKVHVAEAHVSHILDRPLETAYALSETSRSPVPTLTLKELERLAIRARPELKASEVGIQRAKTSRLLAATSWLPEVSGRIEARQFSGEGNIREYDTFLGLTVPVWSLLKGAGGEWKGADRDVQAAEASYQEMKNEVLLAIHEANAKVQTAFKGLTAYEQVILPQAQQQVEVALSAYEAGRSDLLSLIDAERMLRDAQIAYYKFAADYEIGLADMRLAVGGPVVDLANNGSAQ